MAAAARAPTATGVGSSRPHACCFNVLSLWHRGGSQQGCTMLFKLLQRRFESKSVELNTCSLVSPGC